MEKVRLSMVCMNSHIGDIDGNMRIHRERVEQAAGMSSDIICFPELSVTGYAMPDSASNTLSLDSAEVMELADMSAEHGICICFGISEAGGYITQVAAEDGRIIGTYRKTHLGEREKAAMSAGDSLPVFETRKATVAFQVCWESHFPEITSTYALKGADLILMPHASGLNPQRRKGSWDKIIPARAYDNTVFAATCNQVGDNGLGTVFGGGATMFDARGNLVAEDYSGECMLTADLDLPMMESLRSPGYQSMKDLYFLDKRRPEIYFR